MVALVRLALLVFGALLWHAPAAVAPPDVPELVNIFAYDIPSYDEATDYAAPGRGPPSHAENSHVSAGESAVDRGSQGTLARLDAATTHGDTTYDVPTSLAHIDNCAGTTRRPVQAIDGDPSALQSGFVAAKACSFAGATVVLMADGSKKPIEDIRVGNKVIASDPETGEQVSKTVEHVFVHDDTVVDLVVDGETIAATEDHPFWSVTDQRFERAAELAKGEQVLGADGRVAKVSGLMLGTVRTTNAYNLSVEGIHTYHVGQHEILVHNTCLVNRGKYVRELEGGITRTYKKFTPSRSPGVTAGSRYVGETGGRGGPRGWMESYGHDGRVIGVHPKGGDFFHYVMGPDGKNVDKW